MLELDQLASRPGIPRAEALTVGRRAVWSWLLPLVLGVAALVRAMHVLLSDFPLNDGGLFYAMTEDLRAAGYWLPAFTSYNGGQIPYAYPPLGFYLAAGVADVTGASLVDVFRLVPLLVSILTIAAFYLLAQSLRLPPVTLLAAVAAFGLMPRSFIWLLMGGGLTRSLGLLFALLALHQVHRLYRDRQLAAAGPAALFAGLTVLSHIQTGMFLAFSIALLFLFFGRHREGLLGSLLVALGGAALVLPWLAVVVHRHGMAPFIAAGATGGSIVSDPEARRALLSTLARLGVGSWAGGSTGEPLFPLVGTLALLGVIVVLKRGEWLLPTWWLAILVLDTRAGATYAAIPVAMLAGYGITDVLLPVFDRSSARSLGSPRGTLSVSPGGWLLLAFLACYAVFAGFLKHPDAVSETRFLVGLSHEERDAMRWVAEHSPSDSQVLVIPESEWNGWQSDKTSEWFPVLARRVSVATVQGSEWLPDKEFDRRGKSAKELRRCGSGGVECLDRWIAKHQPTFRHIYVPLQTLPPDQQYLLCCLTLVEQLRRDPRYVQLYGGPGGVLFARREADGAPARSSPPAQP